MVDRLKRVLSVGHLSTNARQTVDRLTTLAARVASQNKKLSYCRGTAQLAMLVNSCYVSRGMGVRKVSKSKIDLQGHSRALSKVPFDRPHTISCWCSIATMSLSCTVSRYYHLFSKIYRGHVTLNTSLPAVIHHSCTSTPLYQLAHNIRSA